eukprot:GGOE01006346.1.p1 GENE.GGOE01006346.1~~GGOE01006346.1.p1  ORF type:complete len:279 (-),score=25.45 GGOE01006346.1:914-1723(-)
MVRVHRLPGTFALLSVSQSCAHPSADAVQPCAASPTLTLGVAIAPEPSSPAMTALPFRQRSVRTGQPPREDQPSRGSPLRRRQRPHPKSLRPVPPFEEGTATMEVISSSPPCPLGCSCAQVPPWQRDVPPSPIPESEDQPKEAASDYPAWLAALPQDECDWNMVADIDSEEDIVAHPETRAAQAEPGSIRCFCSSPDKVVLHCALCGVAACDRCIAFATMLPHLGHKGPQLTCKGCHIRATGNLCPHATRRPAARRFSLTAWLSAILSA